jgi:hypothetical protein
MNALWSVMLSLVAFREIIPSLNLHDQQFITMHPAHFVPTMLRATNKFHEV